VYGEEDTTDSDREGTLCILAKKPYDGLERLDGKPGSYADVAVRIAGLIRTRGVDVAMMAEVTA
jgi:hypothetical protein